MFRCARSVQWQRVTRQSSVRLKPDPTFLSLAVNTQLETIVAAFSESTKRVDAMASRLSPNEWARRPAPEHWSPIECVAHLNLTAEAFLPLLRDGLDRARRLQQRPPSHYRRDLRGWLIWRAVKTPGQFRTRTPPAFLPAADRPPTHTLAEFARLQAEQTDCVQASDGLPIHKIMVVSPFDARVKYSVYSALTILTAHQHRHLWQAERAAGAIAHVEA